MEEVEYIATKNGEVIKLPPGFRFRPTDEELVTQYLRRKVASLPLPANIIPEINVWKYNPWDLHGGGEGETYFFTKLEDTKHSRGNKTIRTTNSGVWKPRGKPKTIFDSKSSKIVGMKRTFFFHRQEKKRSHKINGASRTNWIMDEYRLPVEIGALGLYISRNAATVDGLLPLDMKDWVVCKIFQKESSKKVDKEERVQNSTYDLVPSLSLSSCLTDLEEEREKEEEISS